MERINLDDSIARHHATVFRVALGYVKNTHDAEDVTQNVFFKLFKKPEGFESREAEKAWLIRVTVNECKNLLKSAWFRKRGELDEGLAAPEPADDLGLYEYVRQLKPDYRTVVYLHYYERYTAKEIAEILKKPQSTVETQLRRSREQLKKMIILEGNSYGLQADV